MKHFRSLLSLGAIEDDEHIEPFQLNRIRSLQPKSTRLSQRKRQSKLLSEATTNRPSFTSIDGKKLPPLLHSISTKQKRQFNFKKKDRDKTSEIREEVDETREIYLEQVVELEDMNIFNEWSEYDQEAHFDFDLQLPSDTFYVFQSPNATPKIQMNQMMHSRLNKQTKPRLNSELPSPLYPQHNLHNQNMNKLQLNMLLPPPQHIVMMHDDDDRKEEEKKKCVSRTIMSAHSSSTTNKLVLYPNYLSFHPENSITSIKSESIPAQRTSMNSWPSSSQQSILNLNSRVSSKSTHIRADSAAHYQQLSPIYDDERAYGMNAFPQWKDSPHLTQIVSAVQELTDDDDDDDDGDDIYRVHKRRGDENGEEIESEIENEINDEEDDGDDDEYRPRLATIVSQASSVNNCGATVVVDPIEMMHNIHKTYSFPSSQRTSHTMTTNATMSSLESVRTSITYDDDVQDDDVNVAFEYIPDEQEQGGDLFVIDDDDDDAAEIERIYRLRRMDVLLQRDFPWYDFELMDQIGRGAYGVVDKSFHLKSCQIVAIKRSRSLKKQMMDSFKREVLICNEFAQCPYIINMIECGIDQTKNEICIAMEYMNMASLTSRVKYTLDEIRKICFCVLSALEALHSAFYVHNDIKPDNILFSSNFSVKLTDFGCCQRMKDIATPLTQPNGSLIYQSFEKKFLSPIQYTTKSDIYSFGITIAEILNSTHSHHQTATDCSGTKQQPTPYRIPRAVLNEYGDVAPQCIDLLEKCLMRDYNERWSAAQLLSHPFLSPSIISGPLHSDMISIDDLEFITKTLINYYLNYNKTKTQNKRQTFNNFDAFFRDLSKTPIDDSEYSDAQRIQNIAKCTGFSLEAVQDFIFRQVNGVKNKYLKR